MMVEVVGFEPTTLCLQGRCSFHLSYTPICIRVPASRLTHDAFEKKWFERIGVEPIVGVAVSTLFTT